MPAFAYEARDDQGRRHAGARDAVDERDVLAQLRREGLLPLQVTAKGVLPWWRRSIQLTGPRPVKIEMQLRQLGFMLRSGLSLLAALRVCGDQESGGPTARIWRTVADDIRGGDTLHQAMSRHRCFSRLVTSLVDVGEGSGNLDLVVVRAADAMQRQRQSRAQVITALAYPALILVLAVATVAYMMVGVLPKLAGFLGGLGRRLPPSTQLLVDIAHGVQHWFVTGTLVVLGAIVLIALAWTTRRGRLLMERVLLRVPLVAGTLRLAAVSTFAHNTALLLQSGVRLTAALLIVQPLLGVRLLGERLGRARERVVQGSALADSLAQERAFSPMVLSMVAVGEASGTLDEVLSGVAEHHDEVRREFVRRLGALVGPLILIVVGSIVGFIYFAFFMAIYSITGVGRA